MTTDLSATQRATALSRQHMPVDYQISLDKYLGRHGIGGGFREGEERIPEQFGPRQSMSGFESIYHNIIDYIVRITYTIWEDRNVDYIGDTYSDDSNVFDDYGLQYGNQKIIADTYHTTGAFSDIKLIADEIIWAGNDEIGYHTSHRTIIRGHNNGDSKYGDATGKYVDVLVIANCVAKDNEIFLEHVLYNNSALLLQMGFDLEQVVMKMLVQAPAGWPRDGATWQALRAAASPELPISSSDPVEGFDIDAFARLACETTWTNPTEDEFAQYYSEEVLFAGASDRKVEGIEAVIELQRAITSCFEVIDFSVDEVYWMGNSEEGLLVSVRWSMNAAHTRAGIFGEACDETVQIWGISQYQILESKIQREWALFNELDLMMQIASCQSKG